MFIFSLIYLIIFIGGIISYYLFILFFNKYLIKYKGWRTINKFLLGKYKKKYFFWELLIIMRKTIYQLLNIFFKPMLVISLGLCI
jgi:hypothetical protein